MAPNHIAPLTLLSLMQNLSGCYGARTLLTSVHYVPCIKIGDKKFMKITLNFFNLLLGGPSRVPVNPYPYKVLNKFLHGSIAETTFKFHRSLFIKIATKHVRNLFLLDPCKVLAKSWKGTIYSYTKIYEIRIKIHTPKTQKQSDPTSIGQDLHNPKKRRKKI
jgi:hypothetical protein